MSLSFVSSAVQRGTADGGYEETPIESKEVDAVNRRNEHKPLFEQLRQNQEEEEAKQEEMELQRLRGTCALDDDDVAHLEALEKQRLEREREANMRTQDEVALFRAARAERQQIHLEDDDNEQDVGKHSTIVPNKLPEKQTAGKKIVPKFVVKKRKLKAPEPKKKVKAETSPTNGGDQEKKTGLGGLLGGYGSSDDDSDQ
eukprot:scaffold9191_cov114-Cylindrotheca_fusiformis.AAC.8